MAFISKNNIVVYIGDIEMRNLSISKNDQVVLRDLAKKQMDYAQSPEMKNLTELWYKHNDLKGERPMFTIEMWTFNDDIPKNYKCTTEYGREIESTFHSIMNNYEIIGDDKVIPPFLPVSINTWFKPFDIDVEIVHAAGSLGHKFVYKIDDLEEDFANLKKSTFGSSGREEALGRESILEEIFGDILPVKLTGNCLSSEPTQDIVHIMGMENMLFSMCDYPDTFHKLMERLSDDYIEYFKWMKAQHLLVSTSSYGNLSQGSLCYTAQLPDDSKPYESLEMRDVWGYMDSQETVGISPDMYNEFIFPYYKKISDLFGLLSYGCCEPVHPIYDRCLSKCENLRKISISPWCDEELMGERLRGSNIIYLRKPSPNYLGVTKEFDADAWRKHILNTLKAAKGCKLEIVQRDVYSLGGNLEKLKRATQIVKELIEEHW